MPRIQDELFSRAYDWQTDSRHGKAALYQRYEKRFNL